LIAPPGWVWMGFRISEPSGETLSIAEVVADGLRLIDESERTGDQSHFGPVMHWAHILKTEQGPDGAWPDAVNARTGEPIGTARTHAPATLMARLDALLDSTEYAACIERAAHSTPQGEPHGARNTERLTEC
jgi:hypothetical protein